MSRSRAPTPILVVDDRADKLALIGEMLDGEDWRLIAVTSGQHALRALLAEDVAVILLDIDMPGMDGYETARLIRQRQRNAHTPIIFLTAYASDETPVATGYALGAVDYLFAPFQRDVLRAKVAVFAELHGLRAAERRRADDRYAALAEAMPQLVWSVDAAARMTFVNQRWRDYTGLEGVDNLTEVPVHPDDRAAVDAAWRAAIHERSAIDVEFRLRRADGDWRWHLSRGVPRHGADGSFEGWVGTTTDVHDLRLAEQSLAQRERQLSLMMDTLPVVVAYIDRDQRYRFVNSHYQTWWGVAPSEFLGRTVREMMPEPVYAIAGPLIEKALSGEYVRYDARMRLPAIDEIDVDAQYVPDCAEDGTVQGIVVLAQDISDRRRREERARLLAEATELLSRSLEPEVALRDLAHLVVPSIADWCIVDLADRDGGLERVVLHHPDSVAIGLVEELRRDYPPRADDGVNRVFASREPILAAIDECGLASVARDARHLDLLRGFGLRSVVMVPLEARGRSLGVLTLIGTASRAAYDADDLALAQDLAARAGIAIDNARLYQETERQRALATQRADQLAASNAELEQFAYVSSHDLQEPLRMVTQYMGLLERRYATMLDQRGREFIAYAVEGATRMHRLINDLLTYARTGRAERVFARVDLAELLKEVLETLAVAIADKQAQVEVDALPAVRGDRTRLALVLQNLISNALKFSSPPARILILATRRGDHVEVSVSDNGIGIDPQHHQRIFDVFQRLHSREKYPGTGIGLSICRKIVEQHGGRIWVDSVPGTGSTFRFTLPGDFATTGQFPVVSG